MRSLSLDFRAALAAQETGETPILLVTIEHPDLEDGPLRLSSDATERLSDAPLVYGTTSRGETWLYVPFTLLLPDEREEAAPVQRLRISNIDREMVALLRSTIVPATVQAELVRASDPDVVEIAGAVFDMTSATYDASTIEMDLTIDALAVEPVPAGTFNPAQFPGLH